jgi:hypothetical protein
MQRPLFLPVIAGALAVVCVTPLGAQTVYSAADLNVGPGGAHPNSASAAASFDTAAGGLGAENLITFESAPLGSFTSLNAAPGVTVTGKDLNGNPLYINNVPNFPSDPPLDGFNVTPGGSQYLELMAGTATFTFTTPIQAFGAYIIGVQHNFFTDTVTFNDGTSQSIDVPYQLPSNSTNGSLSFVGFTDPGKLITQVTITSGVPGPRGFGDFVGIDDVRFVSTPAISGVPEPGAYALIASLGLSGAALLRRRRAR